jgi:hypothetical protein
MQSKALVVLIAVAILGVGSTAMAKGAGGGGGSMGMHGHGHMGHHHHFRQNPFLFGGWGWGGWGPYGEGNTTVVAFPQATPRAAEVTGSTTTTPCRWNEDTFTVPSSAGGTRPITVASCR